MTPDRRSWEESTIGITLMGMAGLNLLAILSRKWLHLSLPWVEEIEVGLFVWTVFLSGGIAVVKGLHLGFSSLVEKLSERARSMLANLSRGLFAAWFAVFAYYGTLMVLNQVAHDQTSPTLGWPQWFFSMAVPVGGLLGLWRVIQTWRGEGS